MEGIIFAIALIAALFARSLFAKDIFEEGRKLQQSFVEIGNMAGMSKTDIIAKAGEPNSISNLSNGQLLQWRRTGYHIAILFDYEGNFQRITHQSSHK